jgi:2'-5' RNA ligase
MKRIFIAVKIEAGAELLRMISSFKALLGAESIKWVDPGNIHLTLAFLGDTEEKRITNLSSMLKEKCTDFGDFVFILKGTGIFKSYREPRVIWVGIKSSEKLLKLNDLIMNELKDAEFKTEDRPFKPHLTLGRIRSLKDIDNLKTVLEIYKNTEIQTVNVKEVVLFESILRQTGPLYKPLGKFNLS